MLLKQVTLAAIVMLALPATLSAGKGVELTPAQYLVGVIPAWIQQIKELKQDALAVGKKDYAEQCRSHILKLETVSMRLMTLPSDQANQEALVCLEALQQANSCPQ